MAIGMKWVLCVNKRRAERNEILKFQAEEVYTHLTPTSWTLMMLTTEALCAAAAEILLTQILSWTLGHGDTLLLQF